MRSHNANARVLFTRTYFYISIGRLSLSLSSSISPSPAPPKLKTLGCVCGSVRGVSCVHSARVCSAGAHASSAPTENANRMYVYILCWICGPPQRTVAATTSSSSSSSIYRYGGSKAPTSLQAHDDNDRHTTATAASRPRQTRTHVERCCGVRIQLSECMSECLTTLCCVGVLGFVCEYCVGWALVGCFFCSVVYI